ncbi:MAG TPA: AI-2E family transporter, partial [Bellilinea sp.]|nr:AI-2E family transporter [Bellilinea sp.]
GRYIRSEAVQSILAGFLLFVGYSVIGMPFPVLLAIFGAMAWLVPWLGTAIALLPVALFGFWLASPTIAIMGLILTVLVLVFLELVIEPRLFKRRQYNSWLIILFLMALGLTFGVIGLVIAPPIATAIEIFLMRVTQQRPT